MSGQKMEPQDFALLSLSMILLLCHLNAQPQLSSAEIGHQEASNVSPFILA